MHNLFWTISREIDDWFNGFGCPVANISCFFSLYKTLSYSVVSEEAAHTNFNVIGVSAFCTQGGHATTKAPMQVNQVRSSIQIECINGEHNVFKYFTKHNSIVVGH